MLLIEEIRKIIEMMNIKKVICKMCGHSWEIENNDKNPYLCHMCSFDNDKEIFDKKANDKFWNTD